MKSSGPAVAVLEAIEREACRDIVASASAAWAGAGLRHERLGSADLLLLATVPIGHFNRLVGLGVETPARGGARHGARRFAAAGVEDFFIHLSPGAQPAALPTSPMTAACRPRPGALLPRRLGLARRRRHDSGLARRKGAQGALISRRIADALAAGCRDIVADTSEPVPGEPSPAYANMLRNGFRVVYSRPNFRASTLRMQGGDR
jgi:hypothetical protein